MSSNSTPGSSTEKEHKRARKAINCEPCRHSKIKCDRSKPCSSCVLRGTTSMCFQGFDTPYQAQPARDRKRMDPSEEFAKIRNSISALEKHYFSDSNNGSIIMNPKDRKAAQSKSVTPVPKEEPPASPLAEAPGMLGMQGQTGFYTGPTSAASHLVMDGLGMRTPPELHQDLVDNDYDGDLIQLLPKMDILDGLIDYYFEYCNWIYRTVDRPTFTAAWERFKYGGSPSRIVLATVCIIISLAIRYMPVGHELLASLPVLPYESTYMELTQQYYTVMKQALDRYMDESKPYTLELVELLLVRCNYLTFAKKDPEEIWAVKGQLMTIGTAMGLHRDPGRSRYSNEVAERRRWAWWHIYLLESWQAFMFGRPMSLASHHFNTRFPSYCDPEVDPTGRLLLPNIALFKLAYILGEIMADAVSLRPVPYESTLAKDKLLGEWLKNLPSDVDLDEYRIVRYLSSPVLSVRRLGVQSIVLLSSYYHMRFTLHRPYAGQPKAPSESTQSLDVAVNAAERLISLAVQTSPEFIALDSGDSSQTLPHIHGHLNWRPFHVFSAAMFFTFQLIKNPDQPGANLFRSHVRKAVRILNSERTNSASVAEKSLSVLLTLEPLYSEEFLALNARGRELEKAAILSTVNSLAFPYQDPPVSKTGSPAYPTAAPYVPTNFVSGTYEQSEMGRSSSTPVSNERAYTSPPVTANPAQQQQQQHGYVQDTGQNQYQQQHGHAYGFLPPQDAYVPATDSWAGAVGFGKGEWVGFMNALHENQAGQGQVQGNGM